MSTRSTSDVSSRALELGCCVVWEGLKKLLPLLCVWDAVLAATVAVELTGLANFSLIISSISPVAPPLQQFTRKLSIRTKCDLRD